MSGKDDYILSPQSQHDEGGSHQKKDTLSCQMNCYPADSYHSQTVGVRGPVTMQDNVLHEKLGDFVHSKIIERRVHVKGYGAFGYFQTINSMRKYTKLCFLQTPGHQVPVTVRFSFATGNQGTPDTTRTARGFSTKFYTEEGIFDLLCNHLPVIFVRDGMRFPDAIAAFSPSPVNNLIYPETLWSFIARAPEATHFITRAFSDAGTLKSFCHMPGFSVNTYVWKNSEDVRRYVKYKWVPLAGEQYIDRQEATMLAAKNPNIAGQELYDTIESGIPVQYELWVQLMDPDDECNLSFDPLDPTKVWDEQQYPLILVGRLVLNQNTWNFMEQVEKIAFSPANLLEGAELSNDKLLQSRANIYWDAQRRRLGPDFRKIPINYQENWTPNSLVTSGNGEYVEGHLTRSGLPNPDDFTQAGQYYHSLSTVQKNHLVDNLASDLATVSYEIQKIVLGYFRNASAELGARVAAQISVYSKR